MYIYIYIHICFPRQEEPEAEASHVVEDRPVHLCPAPVEGFDEAVKNIWADPPKPVPVTGLVGSKVACHACQPNLDLAVSVKEMTSRRKQQRRRLRKAAGDSCFCRT